MLADFVEVDPAWERAAEEFLHEELEYVVVEDWEQAERGMELLRADSDGRATFLVHGGAGARRRHAGSRRPSLPRLTDYLRLTNGLRRSRRTTCCRAWRAASSPTIAPRRSGWPRSIRISISCCPTALSYHGRTLSGGKKTASGPLALKRELRELTGTLAARESSSMSQVTRAGRLEREIARARKELEQLRALQQAGRKTRWRSITRCASWPRKRRAPIRGSRWRGWNWSGWA